ncbi:hypothetical protein [Paraburkholderia antibiotica]|uniref:Uncharacterized protein n=1 Tax=Paraburkholderia antibiotica TaxID=2728839 RepID=A0A7X9ZXW7_9BURK|nr:hypothetical protein [Paraburkholderia antibiotica]NML32529.1 hypothetical protein [Paraburkholderia antibiotica]
MNDQFTRPRGDNPYKGRAHRSLTLRQRFAATLLRLAGPLPLRTARLTAARMPLHSFRLPQFVSPGVALVRIQSRTTMTGRR